MSIWSRICLNEDDPISLSPWVEIPDSEDVVSVLAERGGEGKGYCMRREDLIASMTAIPWFRWQQGRPDEKVQYYKFPLGQMLTSGSLSRLTQDPPYAVFQMLPAGSDAVGTVTRPSQPYGAREAIYALHPLKTRGQIQEQTTVSSASSSVDVRDEKRRSHDQPHKKPHDKPASRRQPPERRLTAFETAERNRRIADTEAEALARTDRYIARLREQERQWRLKAQAMAAERKLRAELRKSTQDESKSMAPAHIRPNLLKRDPTEEECAMFLSNPLVNPMTGAALTSHSRVGKALRKRCETLYERPR